MTIAITIITFVIGLCLGMAIGNPLNRRNQKNIDNFLSLLKEGDMINIYSFQDYFEEEKKLYVVIGNDPNIKLIQLKKNFGNHKPEGLKYSSSYFREVVGDNLKVVEGRKINKVSQLKEKL